MKVAIAIPAHNRADMIQRSAVSVFWQVYGGEIECVVVDDGSTDGTAAAVCRLGPGASAAHERTLTLAGHTPRRGIAYTKNRCLELALATGADLIGILDSDNWHKPGFVRACVDTLSANPDVGLVYTDDEVVDAVGTFIRIDRAAEWSAEALLRCQLRGDNWLCRREFIEQVRHDERFELDVDYDLFYQLARLTTFKRVPEPLHVVRVHGQQSSGDRIKAAFWHAAGLAKHAQDIHWALLRATGRPDWIDAVYAGYEHGRALRRG